MTYVRFMAIVLAVLASCLAAWQIVGRVVVSGLADYEDLLNRQLADYGVELSGAEGFWRGVNPGLRAHRLVFPFGEFTNVVFELDVLESGFYNGIVARVLQFDEATVALEKTPSGWQLRGQGAQPVEFNFPLFAMNSDIIVGRIHLELHDGEVADEFTVDVGAINRQGRHRFALSVTNAESCADCGIIARGNIADLFDRSPQRGDPSFASISVNDFALRAAPLGHVPLKLDGDAEWYRGDDAGNGRLELELTDARGEAYLVEGGLWEHDDGHRGRLGIRPRNAAAGDAANQDPSAEDGDTASVGFFASGDGFVAWLSRVDLAPLLAAMRGNMEDDAPLGEWLDNLRINGVVEDVRVLWDTDGAAVAASVTGLDIDAYRGVPMLRNAGGTIVGQGGAYRVEMANAPLTMALPDLFDDAWPLTRSGGNIEAWLEGGYLGLRGHGIDAVMVGARAEIGFAFARPDDLYEVRVAVDAVVDRMTVTASHTLIPNNLDQEIRDWMRQSLLGGDLDDGRMVYHGYGRARPGEALNQVELVGSVRDGTIQYHPDWPTVFDAVGRFSVTAEGIFANATARTFDSSLSAVRVELPTGAKTVGVQLKARADAHRVIEFGRIKPLREALYFIEPSWTGEGEVVINADLDIPIIENEDGTSPEGRYDIDFHLDATRLHLVDLVLDFRQLTGSIEYRSPTTVTASGITGNLFGHPMRADIATEDHIVFDVEGTIGVADVYALMGTEDLGMASGGTDFRARAMFGAERLPTLEISDDLYGVALIMPPPIGKDPGERVDFRTSIEFRDEYSLASVHLGETHGWMRVADSEILGGAFGIGASIPASDENSNRVLVSGRLDALDLASIMEQETTTNWQFDELVIDRIDVGEFSIDAAIVNGFMDATETRIGLRSNEIDGVVSRTGEAPWQVVLSQVRIPEESWDEYDESDPLSVDMIEDWVPADVVVEHVLLGTEDYGSWRFSVIPGAAGATFVDLEGELKGLDIRSRQPVFWNAATNETYFLGRMQSSDIARVLREWDYTTSMAAPSFDACADLNWPGSPVNFALAHSSGHIAMRVDQGRFLTADQGMGTMRILSLFNFSNLVKRMSLNFSDVFGEGLSFETLTADVSLDNGVVQFLEPMEIIGSGSHFYATGTANMNSAALDIKMVVTLPLHENLPWYVGYLALATPPSALGLLVGREIFRDQIKQLSSGMYSIRGTYEDPEVVFEGIFTNDMKVPNKATMEGYPGPGGCSLDDLKPTRDLRQPTTPVAQQAGAHPQAPNGQPMTKGPDAPDKSATPGAAGVVENREMPVEPPAPEELREISDELRKTPEKPVKPGDSTDAQESEPKEDMEKPKAKGQ